MTRKEAAEFTERYMQKQMAMEQTDYDQEQNWISGHMHSFAELVAAQVVDECARAACNCGLDGVPEHHGPGCRSRAIRALSPDAKEPTR